MQWSRGTVAVNQSCSYIIHLFTLSMIKPVLKKIAYVSFQPQVNYVDTISKPRISSQDTRLQSLVYPLLFLQSFLVALRQRVDYRDHEVGNHGEDKYFEDCANHRASLLSLPPAVQLLPLLSQ